MPVALAAATLCGLAAAAAPAGARDTPPRLARSVVLVLDRGSVHRRVDLVDPASALADRRSAAGGAGGLAGAAAGRTGGARRAGAARGPSFATVLDRLLAAGEIDQPTRDRDRQILRDARRSFGRLAGTRRAELGAVLANLDRVAAAGQLTASRVPGLVLALARNREWWTTGPLLSAGQRVGFPGSELVWQYYPGQGIEIQWLGTFGKANGYFLGGRDHDAELTALLVEAVGLAVQRAGGIAWEYDFRFDGGDPPWVSGLAQGTAVQALGRAAVRFARSGFFEAAHSALGIFAAAPPDGVRVATPAGAHYLIYSFAPDERVLNAFIQSLVGLRDYAGLANSDTARALFAAGDAEARLEVPRYDTGAWSLYDQSTESDLSYHMLLRDFLRHLCDRVQAAAGPGAGPTAAVAQAAAPPSPAGSPPVPGGTPPAPAVPPPASPAPTTGLPPAGAEVYCTTADHFTAYIHQPPTIAVAPVAGRRPGRATGLRLALSKISEVQLSGRRAGRLVYSSTQEIGHGTRMLSWRPSLPGRYRLSAAATDLAGNAATSAATFTVAPATKHR